MKRHTRTHAISKFIHKVHSLTLDVLRICFLSLYKINTYIHILVFSFIRNYQSQTYREKPLGYFVKSRCTIVLLRIKGYFCSISKTEIIYVQRFLLSIYF